MMANTITQEVVASFKQRLEQHPVYEAVVSLDELRIFMEHHVYSVWDFMSLIKYLQARIAPATYPWRPQGNGSVRRFINELVLEEESDQGFEPDTFCSHFELYHTAMAEIGADTRPSMQFVSRAQQQGVESALGAEWVPDPSRRFTETTFRFIASDKPHTVAAALALGREHIIPCMFRSILEKIGIGEQQAPVFHFYLNRHIHLDEDFHAPLSLQLLNELCDGDAVRVDEAVVAAHQAVEARVQFWDGVLEAIRKLR